MKSQYKFLKGKCPIGNGGKFHEQEYFAPFLE